MTLYISAWEWNALIWRKKVVMCAVRFGWFFYEIIIEMSSFIDRLTENAIQSGIYLPTYDVQLYTYLQNVAGAERFKSQNSKTMTDGRSAAAANVCGFANPTCSHPAAPR